ncbi:MAG: rRNA maturation RNase YbeY [Planctomycetota bacterium]|nr:MAG: rRNA maturation RNase YbeY [Planctomycetota bacterium]
MNAPENHLKVQFDPQVANLGANLSKLEKLVRAICNKFGHPDATVHIGIVDDAGIIEVHRQFLQKDTATDVISFDLSDEFEPQPTFQIIVNAEMADRQAIKRGHSTEAELALYITHGLLHNLGFDDLLPEDAKKMHETEDAILQEFGFGIVYHKQK